MKKKVIIPIAICVILVIGVILFLVLNKGGKKGDLTTITLDINPSIEIKIKEDKVEDIKALNDDGKKVLDKELKGETLEEALNWIVNKTIEFDYIEDSAVVLINIDGEYNQEELRRMIGNPLGEKNLRFEIIFIEETTKEDEELAKEHNITVAKAHFINEVAKEMDINPSDYVNKSISQINEVKLTHNTCEEGYFLRGDFCYKEISREKASTGQICPGGYLEVNGKCYEEGRIVDTDEYTCPQDRTLKGDKCIIVEERDATPSKYTCSTGEAKTRAEAGLTGKNDGDANNIVCVDTSKATHPVSPCELNDGTEWTMHGGVCYWHRAGVLPNGCPGKDIQIGGFCWDNASNILICKGARDGKQYSSRSEYCEGSIKYTNPNVSEYKCEDGFTLNGKMCSREIEEPAMHIRACENGFKQVDGDRCINESKTTDKVEGYVCNKDSTEVRKDSCVTYEIIEANHNG